MKEQGEYTGWATLKRELEYLTVKSRNAWIEGSSLRKIADLAICNYNYDSALSMYQEGLLKVANHAVREIQTVPRRYTLVDQLMIIENRLRAVGLTDALCQLGQDFTALWNEHDILRGDYVRARRILQQWQEV
jgi:hypothetical protein